MYVGHITLQALQDCKILYSFLQTAENKCCIRTFYDIYNFQLICYCSIEWDTHIMFTSHTKLIAPQQLVRPPCCYFLLRVV